MSQVAGDLSYFLSPPHSIGEKIKLERGKLWNILQMLRESDTEADVRVGYGGGECRKL
jgi:hypothetical protein